jgi:hypothetical protein
MITYILHVAIILCACLAFYQVLLRNETFFRLNRIMLLACLVLAFTLPLVHVPPQFSFRKVDQRIAAPISFMAAEHSSAQSTVQRPVNNTAQENSTAFLRNIPVADFLFYIYWTGVAIFIINFMVQLITLLYRAYSRPVIHDGRFRIVELSGDQAPCSFGNSIFINPEKYDWDTYSQILLHEKIHIEQGHSYDIILAEIALVFQWFNPFAWFYRKAVEDNLEFLTDSDLLEHKDIDPGSYQLSLVKVSAPHFPVNLTTNYNQSILKKRLMMMNAKKSNLNTTWKYLCIFPVLLVFVCFVNEPRAYATGNNIKESNNSITAASTFQNEGSWFATIKNDKVIIRFEKDEEGKNSNSSTFLLSEFKNLPRDKEGSFHLVRDAGTMNFTGKFTGNTGMGSYTYSPDQAFMDYLQKEGVDAGGKDDSSVFFAIDLNRSYISMLKKQGYTHLTKENLIPLAAMKIDESFIRDIKSNGFPDVSLEDLIPLKALNVDAAYIKDIRKSGYQNLTVSQLITFKAQNITGDFIKSTKDFAAEGDVAAAVQPQKADRKALLKPQHENRNEDKSGSVSLDDLIAMKAMNIGPDYLQSFKNIGYNVSKDDLIGMKALGVTPEYVKSFENAGVGKIPSDQIIALKALGITAADFTGFKKLGYTNVTIDEVISAKTLGVTPAYISTMKEKGFNLKSIEKYVEAKALTGGF